MKARDVMSSPVITVRSDTPVPAAAALLVSHGFTAAPVVNPHGELVGIVTEADLVRGRVTPEGWPAVYGAEAPVSTVMTLAPTCFRPEDDVADLVELMLDLGVRSVPIVDDGRLVGIVSRRDVLRTVARDGLDSEAWRRGSGRAVT